MKEILKSLAQSPLFNNIDEEELTEIYNKMNSRVKNFFRKQIIAIEEDNCTGIGIVLKGSIEVQKIYPSGKSITINHIPQGGIFGEVIIFSDVCKYPATIMAADNSSILFISKEDILNLCINNKQILHNFLRILSNRIVFLNKKIKNLSYQTIREKIASFLLEEYTKQNNPVIKLNSSKKKLAEYFGVPRPSLSRELINMREEGLIEFDKNTITIKDLDLLEDVLT